VQRLRSCGQHWVRWVQVVGMTWRAIDGDAQAVQALFIVCLDGIPTGLHDIPINSPDFLPVAPQDAFERSLASGEAD